MRVTSHCANHPSREAGQRCRSCGKWLCDRCVQRFRGRVFCGPSCRVRDLVSSTLGRVVTGLRSTVPPFWAVMVVGLAAAVAGSWTGALALRLAAESRNPAPVADRPHAVADLVRADDGLRLEIQGSPGATVVIIADRVPILMTTLGPDGRASIDDPALAAVAELEIAALADSPEPIAPPAPTAAGPTPRSDTTIAAAPTVPSSPTTALTKTPEAVPTRRVTRSATPTASPKATSATPNRRPTDLPRMPSPPVLQLVTDAGPRIAVTFDGNASSNGTAELLDLLHELDLEITLFLTGGFIERHPTLVRRAVLAGHEVGNHTYSHPHLTTYADNRRHSLLPNVNKRWFHDQLRRTEAAFLEATGRPMAPLWRAPYGEENSTLRGWAMELGYLHVRWSSAGGASLDSRDWVADEHSTLYQDPRGMVDRLLNFPRLEGGIVLMHLATERSEPPWTELPRFVRELEQRDVTPVKISELLRRSDTWRPWLERASRRHDETNTPPPGDHPGPP